VVIRRGALVTVLAIAAIGVARLLPVVAKPRPAPREVVLVAKDMRFFLSGGSAPNPTLTFRAGEVVRLVLRNEDAGVTHDFAVRGLRIAVPAVAGRGEAVIDVRVPERTGRHVYACTPHARMMFGHVEIVE
jgi:heme/copper-type cytochrome/quinol oxidase subunit 2